MINYTVATRSILSWMKSMFGNHKEVTEPGMKPTIDTGYTHEVALNDKAAVRFLRQSLLAAAPGDGLTSSGRLQRATNWEKTYVDENGFIRLALDPDTMHMKVLTQEEWD